MIKICKEKSQHQSYAALYLIAKTGMRFAECLGLTVNDIDYTNKYLSINKTWDYHFNQRYLPKKTKVVSEIYQLTMIHYFFCMNLQKIKTTDYSTNFQIMQSIKLSEK
ncbi:TPA: tyrosine-type recombinase/integrase [Streptococcus agalactiae]